MTNIYLQTGLIVFVYMVLWFLLSHWKKDYSLVDIAWGLGFVVLAIWTHLSHLELGGNILFLLMIALWGSRLAIYLFLRNLRQGEDWRYAKMKADWGSKIAVHAFFKIFMLQGILMWIIALPIMQIQFQASYPFQIAGFILWFFGFLWESIADWQLFQFKKQPSNKGKIMTTGLWRYSRHPNYFGEIVLWWGIFIFTIPYSDTWLILLSPLTISWLLIRVSGVPMLERKYKNNPAYQEYIQNTNALLPNFFSRKGK